MSKIHIFQTLNVIFAYKGVFFTNVQKANIKDFIKNNFLATISAVKKGSDVG